MTTRHNPDDHHEHAHLDGGACLDGSGRTWQPGEQSGPFAGPAVAVDEWDARRRLDRLARDVLILTIAVVLLALAAVLHAADHGGWL
jgi:hypothetical protein